MKIFLIGNKAVLAPLFFTLGNQTSPSLISENLIIRFAHVEFEIQVAAFPTVVAVQVAARISSSHFPQGAKAPCC